MRKPMKIIEQSFFDSIPLTIWDYLYEVNKVNEKYLKAKVLAEGTFCVDVGNGDIQVHQRFLNPPRVDAITRNRLKTLIKAIQLECPQVTVKVFKDYQEIIE